MNQIIVKSFGSVEGARKYAGALRSSTRHINAGGDDRDILKIDDRGEWTFGQERTVVERDDVWAINPLTIRHGYIAFEGKEVCLDLDGDRAEMTMSVTQELPAYDQLPELDTRPRKGDKPARWQFQMGLELVCVDGPNKGAEVAFKPCSMGGLRCIRLIAEEIARMFDNVDGGKIVPVVELDSRSYVNKNYGKTIHNPIMHIVEWLGLDENTFATREEVKEDREHSSKRDDVRTAKRDERTAKGDKVDQRRRREAPADDFAIRRSEGMEDADAAEDVAEEPRRGRGRPRNEEAARRGAQPSDMEAEARVRPALSADREVVEDAPVASRGRRGARDRDETHGRTFEAPADEADAPARGRGRRDDEDDRPARDSGRDAAPRGRRAAAGGRH